MAHRAAQTFGIFGAMIALSCASLLELDQYAPGEAAPEASGAGGTSGMHDGASTGEGGAGPASSGSSSAGGGSCAGTLACFGAGNTVGAAACHVGEPVGSCVPPDWDYAACSGAMAPFVFFEPPSGAGQLQAITVVGVMSQGPFNITTHDSNCIDDTVDMECATNDGRMIYRWTNFSTGGDLTTPGPHNIKVWRGDSGMPCFDDPGTVFVDVNYIVR